LPIGDSRILSELPHWPPQQTHLKLGQIATGLDPAGAAKGIPRERLTQIRAPAGLRLGGLSAPEIALSILAEIVQVQKREPSDIKRVKSWVTTSVRSTQPIRYAACWWSRVKRITFLSIEARNTIFAAAAVSRLAMRIQRTI